MGKRRRGPAEKRYRRKKRLVTGSCLIVIFGAIFVAALAVMKTVGVLGPADTSFAAGQTFSEASPEGKGEGDQERANGTAGPIGPESASLIAQEPAPGRLSHPAPSRGSVPPRDSNVGSAPPST